MTSKTNSTMIADNRTAPGRVNVCIDGVPYTAMRGEYGFTHCVRNVTPATIGQGSIILEADSGMLFRVYECFELLGGLVYLNAKPL